MAENEIKEKIISEIKKKSDEPTTAKELCENLNLSYPTISKWLMVLEAEGKIRVTDYGNIKFYYYQENERKK